MTTAVIAASMIILAPMVVSIFVLRKTSRAIGRA